MNLPGEYGALKRPLRPARALALALLIIVAVAVLTIHRLGAVDVCGGNEGVEAVFVQQMVEHGALLFPLENGRQPMYKPPLFHWSAAALDALAGIHKVTAFNLRLPTALYAMAGVALTIGFGWWLLGAGGGLLAGLILAASYQYITLARIGRVDMTLAFCETLALFAFVWWMPWRRVDPSERSPARDWLLYLFALALGLGVLAKGPVGALLPLLAIVIFLFAERRADVILKGLSSPGAVLLALVVGSGWYVACWLNGRYAFLQRQLGSENFGRFFGALGAMAPWYYVKPLFLNSAPLSLLVPIAMVVALLGYRGLARREDGDEERSAQAVRLFAIFYVVTVVFFSIAAYKRRAYLLPLWPASAVMLAWWLQELAGRAWGRGLRSAVLVTCLGLVVFNFFFIPHREVKECGGDSYRAAAAEIDRAVARNEPLYSYGFTDEIAPLLFYLDRNAPEIRNLSDAPPGYVIVPAAVWAAKRDHAPGMAPVLTTSHGEHPLVLLHHGRIYAGEARPRD